jgi:hypothetical protein
MRNRAFLGLLLVLAALASVQASWTIAGRHDFEDSSHRVHASELLLMNGITEAQLEILYFSPKEIRFEVIPNLEGKIEGIRNAVDRAGGIAGTNGGYFAADLSPLGLLVSNGRIVHSAQKAKLLSGVFLVRGGRPEIIRTRGFPAVKGIEQAIQSGPFLVEDERPVSGLNADRVAARTFVFSCGPSCWGMGICRSASLAEMAEIISEGELIRSHHIVQALNLDGGSSSALYAKLELRQMYSEGRGVVGNYLIIGALERSR